MEGCSHHKELRLLCGNASNAHTSTTLFETISNANAVAAIDPVQLLPTSPFPIKLLQCKALLSDMTALCGHATNAAVLFVSQRTSFASNVGLLRAA
jgi:hypothetical protein